MSIGNPFAYVEKTLGPRPELASRDSKLETREEGQELLALGEQTPEEQAGVMIKLQELVAEKRDLIRSMLPSKERKAENVPARVARKLGGRTVFMPEPGLARKRSGDAREAVKNRLDEVQEELYKLGRIPGLHEMYESKLAQQYFVSVGIQQLGKMKARVDEIEFTKNQIFKAAGLGEGGVLAGEDQAEVELLDEERAKLLKSIRFCEGDQERMRILSARQKLCKDKVAELEQKSKENAVDYAALQVVGKKIMELEAGLHEAGLTEEQKDQITSQLADGQRELAEMVARKTAGEQIDRDLANAKAELDVLVKDKKENEVMKGGEGSEIVNMAMRLNLMRQYSSEFTTGRIVETPSVKRIIEQGLNCARKNQPFLLAGHLGSGKTEYAKHIAKLFMLESGVGYDTEKEIDPTAIYDKLNVEIFSGADEASVYDLIGKLKLVGRSSDDPAEVAKRVSQLEDEFDKAGIKKVPREEMAKIILGKGNITETIFNYGPLGRALRDGRPIVIDEINLIPQDILGRLNDILLRRVGDKVSLQENGSEMLEIKPGFAVFATCNLGAQYAGIKDVNAAFAGRWISREVDYPPIDELYDLILTSLIREDRPRLPPNFPSAEFDKLAKLAVTVNEIQDLFSGKSEGQRFMAMATGASAERSQLKNTTISTRDLMRKILYTWARGNFEESLENIIATNVLASSVLADPSKEDQKYMTEIFIRRGFFQDWDEIKFREAGVQGVANREIKALQAAMLTDQFKTSDKKYADLLETAEESITSLKSSLLLGVKK